MRGLSLLEPHPASPQGEEREGKPDNPESPDRYANPGGCPTGAGLGIYAEG